LAQSVCWFVHIHKFQTTRLHHKERVAQGKREEKRRRKTSEIQGRSGAGTARRTEEFKALKELEELEEFKGCGESPARDVFDFLFLALAVRLAIIVRVVLFLLLALLLLDIHTRVLRTCM